LSRKKWLIERSEAPTWNLAKGVVIV